MEMEILSIAPNVSNALYTVVVYYILVVRLLRRTECAHMHQLLPANCRQQTLNIKQIFGTPSV